MTFCVISGLADFPKELLFYQFFYQFYDLQNFTFCQSFRQSVIYKVLWKSTYADGPRTGNHLFYSLSLLILYCRGLWTKRFTDD